MEPVTRALIIDDRQSDADFIAGLLRQAGSFEIIWEADPKRALQRLKEFDVVLLDYQMPVVTGLDLLPEIRGVPVIMLTGQGNEQIAVEAMKRGAYDYLRKDQLTATALQCAVMNVLERRRLEKSIESDLRMARELQQAFLPQSFPHFAPDQLPDAMGLRFYHRYTPTFAVGGDFFDVLPINEHSVGVFVSDVAGHGMQAALVTAVLRTLLEELKDNAGNADSFLAEINGSLHRILRQMSAPVYASAFYLKLDMHEKRGCFANAGHPPQLHIRRKHAEIVRLFDISKTGPRLGLDEKAVFPAHGFPIDAEDVFLLFTDGIIEVPNDAGEPFGIARLESVVRANAELPAAQLIDRIVASAGEHAGAEVFPDDVCLVAVEAASLLVKASR
jgi:serine phosphatase RsbU (regulator of sigma subunit)